MFSDERDAIQKKTFTKWVNKHLKKGARRVTDLFLDRGLEVVQTRSRLPDQNYTYRAPSPQRYEGMPLVILEAMERAVPVVASSVSGIPEVVVEGETGWLVTAENPPELAHALAEVISDESEAARRGEAGLRRVLANYRPENAANRWENEVLPHLDCQMPAQGLSGSGARGDSA